MEKMKQKLSISIDDETLSLIDHKLAEGLFMNKSHFIEYAVKRFLKE